MDRSCVASAEEKGGDCEGSLSAPADEKRAEPRGKSIDQMGFLFSPPRILSLSPRMSVARALRGIRASDVCRLARELGFRRGI
jgi:hypothetical protein